jgi:hypothetical protein
MAKCEHCGDWAGIGSKEHPGCAEMAASGLPPEQITRLRRGLPAAPDPPLAKVSVQMSDIVFGVFLGMWLFTITAAAVGIVIYALTHF